MKLVEAISKRLKDLLDERNYSQYELFKQGGIPRSTINDVVNCKKKRVSTETIYQICATLGMSLCEFFDNPMFNDIDD